MSLTHEDYKNTLTEFTQEIGRLDHNGLSVLLYGSMARGDIIPGHSDLDFWVFLKKEALQNPDRFREAYRAMVDAANVLAESGLPVIHAFCYYGESELMLLPQALVPNFRNEQSSRIVWGKDIRAQMGSTSAGCTLYQTSYFVEMREQMFLPLAAYLGKSLSEKDCRHIVGSLKYVKYVPEAACAALDLWPGELAAAQRLADALPELDMRIVAEVEVFRTGPNPTAVPAKVQEMLQRSLAFVEQLNELLLERTGH